MLQVVAGDEDGGTSCLVILLEQTLQDDLRRRVEEVERLVENDQVGSGEHRRDDTYLLLVACAEVADEFLLSEYLALHEMLEGSQPFVGFLLRHTVCLSHELEVLLGCEEVDEEGLVDVGSGELFPLLALGGIDGSLCGGMDDSDFAFVGFEEVEQQTEESSLTGSVVTDESEHIALVDFKMIDVDGNILAERLFQVVDVNADHSRVGFSMKKG